LNRNRLSETPKFAIASVGTLRPKRLGVQIGSENAQHAVNVRHIGPMLVKLALQLIDNAGEFAALLDQAGNDVITARGHDALRCQ
jgi:hypothetical protein